MSVQNKQLFIISILFDAYWLFCVVLQGPFLWLATLMLGFALWFDKTLFVALPVIAAVGILGDYALTLTGVFQFSESTVYPLWLAGFPLWLVVLWFGFASYLWLMRETVLKYARIFLAMLCAVSGAFSYYAGMKLGAVTFPMSLMFTLPLLFVLWFFYGFLFYFLVSFLNKKLVKKMQWATEQQPLKLDIWKE